MQQTTKKIRGFLIRNKIFALLLAAELAVALALTAGLFGAPYKLLLTGADFENDYPLAAAVDEGDGALKICNDGSIEEYEGQELSFSIGNISLPSGAYEVEVSYFSCATPDAPTFNEEASAGSLTFSSKKYGLAISADTILLDDGHRTATSRLWVGFGARMNDLKVTANYQTGGQLYLYAVRLTEQPIYRVTRLICFLLLAAVLDAALWLAFARAGAVGAQKRRAWRVPLAILGITVLACLPFFYDGLIYGDDLEFHLQRIAAFAAELSYGNFPVRLYTSTLNGYGYASPLCYCDLFLLPAALLYNAWLPLRVCYQVYAFGITLATAVIAYGCFVRILKDKRYALLGTMLYTLSAYRLTNVYIRAAVGEYTAMAFLPLVLLGLYEMYTTEKPRFVQWGPMAFGMAALVQCHLLTVELTAFLLIIFCVLRLRKTLQPACLLAWIKAAALAVGLSAWYFFPFVISNRTIPFMVSHSSIIGKIQDDGLYLMQLLSPFGPGRGESVAGPGDFTLTLGLPLLIGLGMVGYCLAVREKWQDKPIMKLLYTASGFAAFTMLLTLEEFPWDAIHAWLGDTAGKLVSLFQFPWRFLEFSTLLLTFAALLALRLIAQQAPRVGKALGVALACCALLYMGVAQMQTYTQQHTLTENSMSRNGFSHVMVGEYVIDGTSIYETTWAQPKPGSEELTLTKWEQRGGKSYLSVENTGADAPISVPIFNYGNYHAADENGTEFAITSGENERIVLQIPAGYTGTITIWYQEPGYWRLFELTSALTLLGTVWYAVHTRKRPAEMQTA